MKRVILMACIACAAMYLPVAQADEDSADTHVHKDARDLAAMIAKDTEGVSSVRNRVTLAP